MAEYWFVVRYSFAGMFFAITLEHRVRVGNSSQNGLYRS